VRSIVINLVSIYLFFINSEDRMFTELMLLFKILPRLIMNMLLKSQV